MSLPINACIACTKPRVKGGFCAKHYAAHEASPWVKAWRIYQGKLAKCKTQAEKKKIVWVAPRT